MGIRILKGGMMTTVQDLGRTGYQSQGFSVAGVSVIGGVTHNLGQILVAVLVVENVNLFYYFPALLVAGLITGMLIGIVSGEVLKRVAVKVK